MSTTTVAKRRKALLTRIAERGDADARLDTAFLDAYFQHVLTEDLLRANAEDLHGAVANHLSLAGRREPWQIQVQAFTPNVDTHGWGTGATILQVVADDTPFIVDSIIAELGRQGRQIRLLAHPQLRVGRDDQGNLTSLDAQDGTRESWAHVELAAIADPAAADEIATGVRAALQDVALAVADWQPMVARAGDITAETEEGTQELLQWLPQDNFLFLGYRQYRFTVPNGDLGVLESVPGTGLGILRGPESRRELTGSALARALRKQQLTITKANALSTVRRSERLDYIGIKTFDADGNVNGEHRFLGLFTARAYNESIEAIPFLAVKTREVLDQSGFEPRGHAAKHLLSVLQTYPRDEVLQADANHLSRMVNRVVASRHHRKTMLFARNDEFERFVSCVVMVPRDLYSTDALERIGTILLDAFQGAELEHAVSMPSSQANTAIVHFVVRMGPGQQIPDADVTELEGWIRGAIRTWPEDWEGAMGAEFGEIDGHRLIAKWGPGLDEAYRATHSPRQATLDVRYLENLGTDELQANLYTPQGAQPNERRLRLYSSRPIGLTEVLPKLLSFGVDVFDERSFDVVLPDGASRYLLDYGLAADSAEHWGTASRPSGFLAGFLAVWRGQCETDGFNRLVGSGDLTWPQVVILRMIAAYLAQTTQYSRDYIQAALTSNSAIAVGLVEVFEARFTPDGQADRVSAEQQAADAVIATLADVPNLDHDRIIRAALSVIRAGLRTNFYQPVGQDAPPGVIAFKVEPERIPHLLPPRPQLEIWVYGASVEGAHFRFGRIARGGIRWSSRREDFRTEVLGLVKAQMVKNSVIVPTGAKGAFYPKNLPDPQRDPAAWREQGRQAYRAFITALLSITDNLVDGETVHPDRVVRHDGDDTYLVVAADKGTATFSDLANEIAEEHRFWLGDAFASGGSTGYDHKAMAITARGAWASVTRHFRELGVDPASQDFTAVGVGDMSGDVFGNGMLQSQHIRLVAAFDHRDIFIDPDPDPASSYAERQRLFTLPRSSWQDYSTDLISDGGGVFSRSAKVVPISARMQELLPALNGAAEATPTEVIRAILQARVDLVWNGGIGTYIKASTERNEEIGDPGNDSVRVDGNQLNCAVVGEGGNLGVSQLGRIEAAQNGVRINTDAIDNSAGVDSSDYEVNIKILLNTLVSDGK
ncbi:MAG: NAD-glutamate dehydrogenase domain-containing protein, partial [Brooklawnia sp.]